MIRIIDLLLDLDINIFISIKKYNTLSSAKRKIITNVVNKTKFNRSLFILRLAPFE